MYPRPFNAYGVQQRCQPPAIQPYAATPQPIGTAQIQHRGGITSIPVTEQNVDTAIKVAGGVAAAYFLATVIDRHLSRTSRRRR